MVMCWRRGGGRSKARGGRGWPTTASDRPIWECNRLTDDWRHRWENPMAATNRGSQPIVHFVGSLPLPDAETVFRTLPETAGPYLLRLPDGETGIRKTWIRFLQAVLADNPAIEVAAGGDRKRTRLNSSHGYISDAVFCLQKK